MSSAIAATRGYTDHWQDKAVIIRAVALRWNDMIASFDRDPYPLHHYITDRVMMDLFRPYTSPSFSEDQVRWHLRLLLDAVRRLNDYQTYGIWPDTFDADLAGLSGDEVFAALERDLDMAAWCAMTTAEPCLRCSRTEPLSEWRHATRGMFCAEHSA